MPEEERQSSAGSSLDRVETTYVDRGMRITTSLGFLFSAGAALWFVLAWTDRVDDQAVEQRSEIQALRVIVEDVADRQGKYIERNATTHESDEAADDAIHHSLMVIREFLAAKYGETLP